MRKIIKMLFVFLSLVAFNSYLLKAQENKIKNLTSATLYNGVEYLGHSPKIIGTPFFSGTEYQKGSLVYDKVDHNDVLLKYDLVTDELVTPYLHNNADVALISGYVSTFSIADAKFVYLSGQAVLGNKISSGYYQELVGNKVSFYIKRKKNIKETSSVRGITSSYVDVNDFYIVKDSVWHKVSSKSSVLNVFKEKKKELNTFLKEQSIDFRDNPELAIVKLTQEYNELIN